MTRVLYLGQKPVGEAAFEQLLAQQGENLRLCAVCTNQSTALWWGTRAIWDKCEALGIDCVENDARREDELLALIKKHDINTILSVQHNWILSEKLLMAVRHNALNLHLAPLPAYRGYYAFNHAILNGDAQFGVTLHWMTKAVDEGQIAFAPTFDITERDTAWSLYQKALAAGTHAFGQLVEALAEGRQLPRLPMLAGGRFYGRDSLEPYRKITDIDDADELDLKARAMYFPPYYKAWFAVGEKKYRVEPEDTGV